MAKPQKKIPSALPLANELLWGGWSTYALAAAVNLDVFTAIAAGKTTAREIAEFAGANEAMMRRLLDAVVALKYLLRKGDRYALSPAAETFLVRGGDLYLEGIGGFGPGQMMGWFQLAEVVKNGGPLPRPEGGAGAFFAILVKCIFPTNYVQAKELVARMPRPARARIKNVLDVAAGAAPWSIPFAQANRATRVTVVDLPEVTPVTREYAAKFGVAEQFDYLEGDLHQVDFGTERYDLIVLGHIIHGEGRENGIALINRCAKALRERGLLLIAELIPHDDRSGPPLPMLFGLNMMIHTPGGDVFTMKEYRGWLKEAGFKSVKPLRVPSAPSPLILATR